MRMSLSASHTQIGLLLIAERSEERNTNTGSKRNGYGADSSQ